MTAKLFEYFTMILRPVQCYSVPLWDDVFLNTLTYIGYLNYQWSTLASDSFDFL